MIYILEVKKKSLFSNRKEIYGIYKMASVTIKTVVYLVLKWQFENRKGDIFKHSAFSCSLQSTSQHNIHPLSIISKIQSIVGCKTSAISYNQLILKLIAAGNESVSNITIRTYAFLLFGGPCTMNGVFVK